MGTRDQPSLRSDSGYGDDASEAAHDGIDAHPLTLKGYEIGPASKLGVGDVFEFLWADAAEFEWEWKCLGYTRFIVLRHSDTFPHRCTCIPISTGNKHEFAKPGIDNFQQGYVFASSDPAPSNELPAGRPRLPFSPIVVELRPGRLRIRDDSRANYADIIEIDHEAQVMVVGDVARYFDRVRRNVNKAFMRGILRRALEEYRAGRAGAGEPQTDGKLKASETESVDDDSRSVRSVRSVDCRDVGNSQSRPTSAMDSERRPERQEERRPERREERGPERRDERRPDRDDPRRRQSSATERQIKSQSHHLRLPKSSGSAQGGQGAQGGQTEADYDLRSMHNVAMAGLK